MSPSVPFLDLARWSRLAATELEEAVRRVLQRGWFIQGPEGKAFEEEFARYCGVRYCVGVANGTDAISLALRAAGVGPGDEVITTPLSAVFTALAIRHAGAVPVFADVDAESLTLDPRRVVEAITPKTRALLPVHLYGDCADLPALQRIAEERRLVLIEDAAQAHGARQEGKPVGSIGAAGCFSFYPTKNLGAFGDAGAIGTNDDALAGRLRVLRDGGRVDRDRFGVVGFNSRLDELQAALLRVQLRHLPSRTGRRKALAQRYRQALQGSRLTLPPEKPDSDPVYHQFVVRSSKRDAIRESLDREGVETLIHYPLPIPHQEPFRPFSRHPVPVAEEACRTIFSLPLYPELTDEEQARVISALRNADR